VSLDNRSIYACCKAKVIRVDDQTPHPRSLAAEDAHKRGGDPPLSPPAFRGLLYTR